MFKIYKKRWKIETFYNRIKNRFNFLALHQQNYFCLQGLSFALTVAALIYQELAHQTEKEGISLEDALTDLNRIKIVLSNGNWEARNITKGSLTTCKKLNFKIPLTL